MHSRNRKRDLVDSVPVAPVIALSNTPGEPLPRPGRRDIGVSDRRELWFNRTRRRTSSFERL